MVDICSCTSELIEWIIAGSLSFNAVLIYALIHKKIKSKAKVKE